jgi:hypothetical protein
MNYSITDYTKDKAKKYGVSVRNSHYKGKKIDVIKNNIVIASVGAIGYSDYPTYMNTHGLEYANKRRKLYRIRHKTDRNIINTNGYWADRLLW